MRNWLLAAALFSCPVAGHAAEPQKTTAAATAGPSFPDPSTWTVEQHLEASIQARVALARICAKNKDILGWGRAVMPDKFYRGSCQELHGYFVSIRHAELTSTVAPRGHAKTFVKCCVIPLFQALEEPWSYDYFVNIQATNKKGVAVNFAIKYEIETNPVLRRMYGDQVGTVKWTDELFMLKNGVVFQGAGAGDSIKGMQFLNRRPKYEIVDDLYDEEDINQPERIEAKNDWFWGSLYPTRARGKGTSFQVQGTVAGPNDLMLKLGEMSQTDTAILHREFAAYDPATGKVLWPELNSLASLEQERERMGSVIFDREMQGVRRNAADAVIKEDWLKGWEYDPARKWANLPRDFGVASSVHIIGTELSCDPSTGKDEGDPAAFGYGVQTLGPGSKKELWIEWLEEGNLSFDARLAKLEALKSQIGARLPDPEFRLRRAYVESIGGFKDFGEQAKAKTGLPVELVTWVKGKLANLSAKSGHFEFGRVHISTAIPKKTRDRLVDQLLSNEPVHDDLRDVVLMLLEDPSGAPMRSWVTG